MRLNLGAYSGRAEVAEGRSTGHVQNNHGAYHGRGRGSGRETQRLPFNVWLKWTSGAATRPWRLERVQEWKVGARPAV